jgi:hypothetical protein
MTYLLLIVRMQCTFGPQSTQPNAGITEGMMDRKHSVTTVEELREIYASGIGPYYEQPQFVRRTPRKGIRLDSERTEPSTVLRLTDRPLHYVIDKESTERDEVAIFTRLEDAQAHAGATLARGPGGSSDESALASSSQVTFSGYVELFEHINYQGANWTFWTNWGPIPDFTRVYPTLWWSTNINDRVSSINVDVAADPPGTIAWAVLFTDIFFGGDSLWTSSSYSYPPETGGGMRANLVDVGWNDRASSLAYGYSV